MEPRLVRARLSPEAFREIVAALSAADFVKVVVDLEREVLALGGDLHADGEQVLLDDGAQQAYLWGANVYPRQSGDAQIEYTSLINIRPSNGNRSMDIEDPDIRAAVAHLLRALLPLS